MAKGADTRSTHSTCASFVDFDHDDYVVLLPFWCLSTVRISRLTVILLPDHIIFEPSSDSSIVPDITYTFLGEVSKWTTKFVGSDYLVLQRAECVQKMRLLW